MTHPDSPDSPAQRAADLERRLAALLREQPLQRAPATLALRVMAAIEQRQRSAFKRWPLAVRIAFVVLAGATAHLTIGLMRLLTAGITTPRPPVAVVLAETVLAAARQLPSLWSHAALLVLVVIYGGMFGIAVAMYRTIAPRH